MNSLIRRLYNKYVYFVDKDEIIFALWHTSRPLLKQREIANKLKRKREFNGKSPIHLARQNTSISRKSHFKWRPPTGTRFMHNNSGCNIVQVPKIYVQGSHINFAERWYPNPPLTHRDTWYQDPKNLDFGVKHDFLKFRIHIPQDWHSENCILKNKSS